MSHFAHITNGVVDQVIVIEQDVLDQAGGWEVKGEFKPASEWVQTSYNTYAGDHKLGGQPLRKNYAGIGFAYDSVRDAFIPPKPYESWALDEAKCIWDAPIPRPDLESEWDEKTGRWIKRIEINETPV